MIGKIYKPGQGYWTRMVSAVAVSVIVAWAVVWLWEKLSVFGESAIFLQGGMAVVLLGGFGLLLLRYLGTKPESCDFLIATEGEMKKVNWPTRREVFGSTWIVVCSVFMLAMVLFLADIIFMDLFTLMGVLEGKKANIVLWCNTRSLDMAVVYLTMGGAFIGGIAAGLATLRKAPEKQFLAFAMLVAAFTVILTGYTVVETPQADRNIYDMIFMHISTFFVWLFIAALSVLLGFLAAGLFLSRSAPAPRTSLPEQMR